MESIKLKARAKINLALDVTGTRPDGYHDVRMVMQSIGIYDGIDIEKTDTAGIELQTNLRYLPVNEHNLAYRAAKILADEFCLTRGVRIRLYKYIPVAAGLAGGSTDAAAVLFGMNRLFGLGLSLSQLIERGAVLGADVPFCLMRGTVLAEGVGEILTPLPACPACPVIIAKPPVSVSTKYVYDNLKLDEHTAHPDVDGMVEAIRRQDIRGVAAHMGNVLESVTIAAYPVIEEIKRHLMGCGALNAMMSGSGPAVFALFEDAEQAKKALDSLKETRLAGQLYLTDLFAGKAPRGGRA